MHTLNEQVRKITHGTFADVAAQMIAAVVALTGWEYDDSTYDIFPDPANHATKIHLEKYSSSDERVKVYGYYNGTVMDSDYCATNNNDFYVRVHKSTGETVTYVSLCDDEPEWKFIWAKNLNNEFVLFQGRVASQIYVGTNDGVVLFNLPAYNNTGKRFSAAKFTDSYSEKGGAFSELYYIYDRPDNGQLNNFLVSFEGTVMRLISLYSNTQIMPLAFPVSEGAGA